MGRAAAKLLATMLLSLSLTICFVQPPKAQLQAEFPQNRVTSFLRQVLLIDMDHYNVTQVLGPFKGDQLPNETYGGIDLQSSTGRLEFTYKFANDIFSFIVLDNYEPNPKYTQQLPSNLSATVQLFLEKYQLFSQDHSIQDMEDMLVNADLTKSSTVFKNSLKMQIEVIDSATVALSFQVMFDGAEYSELGLEFYNGTFHSLNDDRSYVRVGGGTVNVSKDQAVQIALGSAQVPSWASGIDYDQIRTGLFTKGRDSEWTWYPYWQVILPLDGSYDVQSHGGSIIVEIWADTALVNRVYLGTGSGGEPFNMTSALIDPTPTSSNAAPSPSTSSPFPTLSPSPTSAPTTSPTQQPTLEPSPTASPTPTKETGNANLNLEIAVLVVIVVVVVGLLVYFLKKEN